MPEDLCEFCGYKRRFFCCAQGGQAVYDERDALRVERDQAQATAETLGMFLETIREALALPEGEPAPDGYLAGHVEELVRQRDALLAPMAGDHPAVADLRRELDMRLSQLRRVIGERDSLRCQVDQRNYLREELEVALGVSSLHGEEMFLAAVAAVARLKAREFDACCVLDRLKAITFEACKRTLWEPAYTVAEQAQIAAYRTAAADQGWVVEEIADEDGRRWVAEPATPPETKGQASDQ